MSGQQNEPWNTFRPRAALSVSALARAVGLSRSQFYTYIRRGVFPQPLYSLRTRRPFYSTEMQQEIVEVRATGIGLNGEYVLFYERGVDEPVQPQAQPGRGRNPAVSAAHSELIEGLRGLGMTKVSAADVDRAVAVLFPGGTVGKDSSDLLPVVYRHLRRQGIG